MLKKNLILTIAVFIWAFVFSACSEDDNPANPKPSVGTVLFSLDSLGVIVSTSNSFAMQEEAFGNTINASKVRVEYRLRSNLDTANCYVMREDSTNSNTSIPPEIWHTGPFDTNYTYLYDVSVQPFYFSFKVWVQTYSGIPNPYYIYYSNIRIIKAE
jgi:hypothetical protein